MCWAGVSSKKRKWKWFKAWDNGATVRPKELCNPQVVGDNERLVWSVILRFFIRLRNHSPPSKIIQTIDPLDLPSLIKKFNLVRLIVFSVFVCRIPILILAKRKPKSLCFPLWIFNENSSIRIPSLGYLSAVFVQFYWVSLKSIFYKKVANGYRSMIVVV